ncbi:MAG: GNAT family N-acetyltransferase [Vitreoscilla sp.]
MRIVQLPDARIDGIALRQIEPADCEAWFDYLRLPQVFERTSWNLRSVDDLRPTLDSCLRDDPTSPMRMAVVDQATDRLVGTIGLHTISDVNRSAEIAYDFAPGHWGRGLATRLCEAVSSWSFATLGLHRLQATVLVGNERSERVLARCRYRHEGLLRGFRMVRGRPGDFNIFSRLATDEPAGGAARDGQSVQQ